MAANIFRRPTDTGPISASQFLANLQQTWAHPPRRSLPLPRHLGLAVSGGADSMALAYLCRQLQKNSLVDRLDLTAFVIDHQAREESGHEARTVSRWLDELGVASQIIELDWSQYHRGLEKPTAFETYARKLRFQALGKACAARGVEALLLGHHQDDNVETVIQRLSQRARSAGLAGMGMTSPFPECGGIYGVAESGTSYHLQRSKERASAPLLRTNNAKREVEAVPWVQSLPPRDFNITRGGILVCRPLLSCVKENLVATCRENGVPFVTDPTNFDPSLTPRNTIRQLLDSGQLPRALRPESILRLAERANDLLASRRQASNNLLQKCKILDFDIRGGWMLVRFPPASEKGDFMHDLVSVVGEKGSAKWLAKKAEIAQSFTLRRISRLLSPRPTSPTLLNAFARFSYSLFFPDLVSTTAQDGQAQAQTQQQQERKPFTVNQVIFTPYRWSTRNRRTAATDANNNSDNNQAKASHPTDDDDNLWLISRQPYFTMHPLPTTRFDVPLPSPTTYPKKPSSPYTPWQLWDNRYWLRLCIVPVDQPREAEEEEEENSTPPNDGLNREPEPGTDPNSTNIKIPLTIRPLTPDDFHQALTDLKGKPTPQTKDNDPVSTRRADRSDELFSRISHLAPGHAARYSIPLLTLGSSLLESDGQEGRGQGQGGGDGNGDGDGKGQRQRKEEQFIALPSLGFRFSGSHAQKHDFVFRGRKWLVRWEWMFREMDLEVLELMGWVDKLE